jgi:hypothetical protein
MSDPATNPEHAARMIRQCRTVEELDGYTNEARRRGIAAHELELIERQRNALRRK